jgi:hypothetical protein
VTFGVVIARVAHHLTGEREQLVAPREECRHEAADLRRCLIYGHLKQ